MLDQAEKLRDLMKQNKDPKEEVNINNKIKLNMKQEGTKVYTIASGKGGVGKSNLVVNLAICLSKRGLKVLVFDADIGMSNDHVLMNMRVNNNIFDLINENLELEDIIVKSPYGVDLISSGSALNKIFSMADGEREVFLSKLSSLNGYDYVLIDTGAGINRDILSFIAACDEFIVVTTPEPTSITDAYSLIKTVNYFKIKESANIIINKALYSEEAEKTFSRIKNVTEKFLQIDLNYYGCILEDRRLVESVRQQVPVYIAHSNCPSSKCFDNIADLVCNRKKATSKQGLHGFFKNIFKLLS